MEVTGTRWQVPSGIIVCFVGFRANVEVHEDRVWDRSPEELGRRHLLRSLTSNWVGGD